jgi:hypothetical protein
MVGDLERSGRVRANQLSVTALVIAKVITVRLEAGSITSSRSITAGRLIAAEIVAASSSLPAR